VTHARAPLCPSRSPAPFQTRHPVPQPPRPHAHVARERLDRLATLTPRVDDRPRFGLAPPLRHDSTPVPRSSLRSAHADEAARAPANSPGFPGARSGGRSLPWRDIRSRALSTPRWIWLPANGLDQLRKIAEQRGTWRYTDDGYIEKGPFEKPKTSVVLVERGYEEETGEATIEVTPRDSGRAPRVYYDTQPKVTSKSSRLNDSKLTTQATRVWFVAEDSNGGSRLASQLPGPTD